VDFVQNIDTETVLGRPIVIHVNAVENLTSFAIYFIHYALKIYKPESVAVKCTTEKKKSALQDLSTIFDKFLFTLVTKKGKTSAVEYATFMCDVSANVKIRTMPVSV
jgi:hypothetical protein